MMGHQAFHVPVVTGIADFAVGDIEALVQGATDFEVLHRDVVAIPRPGGLNPEVAHARPLSPAH